MQERKSPSTSYHLLTSSLAPSTTDETKQLTELYNKCMSEMASPIIMEEKPISQLYYWSARNPLDTEKDLYTACLNFMGLKDFASSEDISLHKSIIFVQLQSISTHPSYLTLLTMLNFSEKYIPQYCKKREEIQERTQQKELAEINELGEAKKETDCFDNHSLPEAIFLKEILSHYGKKKIKALTPELILKKFTFTDPAATQRKFKNISSIQYAAWCGNTSLLEQLLAQLHEEMYKVTAAQQLLELKTGITPGSNLPSDFLKDFDNMEFKQFKLPSDQNDLKQQFFRELPISIQYNIHKYFQHKKHDINSTLLYNCPDYSFGYRYPSRKQQAALWEYHESVRLTDEPFDPAHSLSYYEALYRIEKTRDFKAPAIQIVNDSVIRTEEIKLQLEKQIMKMQTAKQSRSRGCIIS